MQRAKILVACQDRAARQRLAETFRFRYQTVAIDDGWLALHLVNTTAFEAMVIAERLDSLSGLDVVASVRANPRNGQVPIMLVARAITPTIREMVENGMVDRCVAEGVEGGAFLFEFNTMCSERAERAWDALDADVARVLRTARRSYNRVFSIHTADAPLDAKLLDEVARHLVAAIKGGRIAAVMRALQGHDDYTFVHSLSVAAVLAFFGKHVGIREGDLCLMAQAGFAHDFGKRVTPLAVLYKPGPLDSAQMVVIRRHAAAAGQILRCSDGIPAEVVNVAERHHERLDGTGYPNGLAGAQIDDLSAVAAIGDVFSALVDNRCYKPGYAPEEALRMLGDMAGPHLEPAYVKSFSEVMHDTGFTGWVSPPQGTPG